MSDWADGEGFTTLEDVFTSREFGRAPQAAAVAPVAKANPRAGRAHLLTNRAIAVLSVGAASLSVVATLAVNGGGPSLAPVISAQRAPSNVPDFLTPVPSGNTGQGGATGTGGATGANGAAPGSAGSATGAGGASVTGAGGASAGAAGTNAVALGPSGASASLTSFTVSHPTHPTPPPPPPPTTSTTPTPTITSGGAAAPGNGKGNANGVLKNGNNGNGGGNGNGNGNNGGGGVVFVSAVRTAGGDHGKG